MLSCITRNSFGMCRNKLTLAELLGPAPSSFGNALGSISPLRLDGRGACILRPQTLLVGRSCAKTREENGFLHFVLGFGLGREVTKRASVFEIVRNCCSSWAGEEEQLCHRAFRRTYQLHAKTSK